MDRGTGRGSSRRHASEAEKNGILGHGLHHPFHTMFEDVFEELPWHLSEQAEQAIRERRTKWPDWDENHPGEEA